MSQGNFTAFLSELKTTLETSKQDFETAFYKKHMGNVPGTPEYDQRTHRRKFADAFRYLQVLVSVYDKDRGEDKYERLKMAFSFMVTHVDKMDGYPGRYAEPVAMLKKYIPKQHAAGGLNLVEILKELDRLKTIFNQFHPGYFDIES